MNVRWLIPLAIPALVALHACSSGPTRAGREGGGSEVVAVAGRLVDSGGAPVANASVYLRPDDYLPALDKKLRAADALTGDDGRFEIAVTDTQHGVWVLEGRSGSFGVMRACTTTATAAAADLGALVLERTGGVHGRVAWSHASVAADVFVRAYGLERRVALDADDYFRIEHLPAGRYRFFVSAASTAATARILEDVTVEAGSVRAVSPVLLGGACEDGACDSAVVRHVLAVNGIDSARLSSVVTLDGGRVTGLSLAGTGLTHVPGALEYLAALQSLDLHGNALASLPPELGNLVNLRTLLLNDNTLGSVPATLAGLSSLDILRLSGNELAALPEALAGLTALSELSISDNRLCDITSEELRAWLDTKDPDWQSSQVCP